MLHVPVLVIADPDLGSTLARDTALAASWWASLGVELSLVREERRELSPVLGGDIVQLDLRMAGLPEAEAAALVREEMLAPLRAWISGYRAAREPMLVLVLAERLAEPSSPIQRVVSDLAGLTLSKALRRAQPRDEIDTLLDDLEITPDFPPTVFIGADQLAKPGRRWVVAHEIGHALGLRHDSDATNLMAEAPARCRPSLRAEQLQAILAP